ncbi:MAG: hypothetical protein JWN70_4017 [Planctomycetaceae bacterium]|nr:hypothetical protein [Planctomycetaceae bacterium]
MTEFNCSYRSVIGQQPVCQVVADLTDLPLAICHTNDSACEFCLKCEIAPQVPNVVTASMSIHAAGRAGEPLHGPMSQRMKPHLGPPPQPPNTVCVLRGPEIRKVACKPCQADSLIPVMLPVFRCPLHGECTLHNTGTFPKIQACATCGGRREKYVQLDVKPASAAVVAAIARRGTPTS